MLTTHYMEEAERLCDRVAIVDHGRVIALGSPRELMESIDVSHLPPPEPRKTSATLEDVFVEPDAARQARLARIQAQLDGPAHPGPFPRVHS